MFKILPALLAISFAVPAAAHELATSPALPHPIPQGVPYAIIGAQPHPVSTLRFVIINGRRALADGRTGEIVYVLRH